MSTKGVFLLSTVRVSVGRGAPPLSLSSGTADAPLHSLYTPFLENSRQKYIMASSEPSNFSWVEPGKVAGLALPCSPAHYRYLLDNGIQHLVCLCERKPKDYDTCPDVQLHHIKIPDFTAPSPQQIDKFLSIVEEANAKGEGVATHCMHGHGRTGTMLACYLVKSKEMSGIDAINEIRRLRTGSIETHEQEKAVVQFYQRTK